MWFLFIANDTALTTSEYIGNISFLAPQSVIKIILSCALPCYFFATVMAHQYLSTVSVWTMHMEFVKLLGEILEWNGSTELFIKCQT